MQSKRVIVFLTFVGLYLVITNTIYILHDKADVLKYLGLVLGITHLVYVLVELQKRRGNHSKVKGD